MPDRAASAAFLASKRPLPSRDAQLRRHHHRLDRRRMGVAVAAQSRGNHYPAGRTVHATCQSDPGAKG